MSFSKMNLFILWLDPNKKLQSYQETSSSHYLGKTKNTNFCPSDFDLDNQTKQSEDLGTFCNTKTQCPQTYIKLIPFENNDSRKRTLKH